MNSAAWTLPAMLRRAAACALALGAAAAALATPPPLSAPARDALLAGGAILVMRHATAPGVGDPPGFRVDDCATQRNLSDAGRAEARELGRQLADAGIRFAAVESSPWCRCLETAELVFGTAPAKSPELASLFGERAAGDARSAALRQRIRTWQGPGNLAWVTHQVNISLLVGRALASNQALVLVPHPSPDGYRILDLHETPSRP